jgi:DNA-binding winged helix-turn-helix (wHTH) protein/tetratricopeptide (TPR) repeat protein
LVKVVSFPPFTLDVDSACLIHDGARISLSPKDCALLRYLAANPGRVISHAELLREVWSDTTVGPDVLKVRIARLRRLLGDSAIDPRFIASVHGEGYRFLTPRVPQTASAGPTRPPVVGRDADVAVLDKALAAAANGHRRVVFVAGDVGIGKTTLIDLFVERAAAQTALWIGRGQCIQHYGSGEPYLPVMEALGRLGRSDGRDQLKVVLTRYAPLWLLQLPALLDDEERDALQRRVFGATRERMLRELAEALEAFDAAALAGTPVVVLVLEDLHWADLSTLDLLRMLAHRPDPARLLVLASYRRDEATVAGHPLGGLVKELRAHDTVTELVLEPLGDADVTRYLDERFPGNTFPAQLGGVVHRRTAGNPLFVADLIRDLRAHDVIVGSGDGWTFHGDVDAVRAMMPVSIRQLVARQRDALTPDEQRLLGAASIAGLEFSAAAVAAALEAGAAEVEEECLRLTEHHPLLRVAGSEQWPDGTQSARFAFLHALHRELWQERVVETRRREWHLRIAERKESAYAHRAPEVASELAEHFEQGHDYAKAVTYREHASRLALQRAANTEAQFHIDRAFALLRELPDTPRRRRQELPLQVGRGTLMALTGGYGSPQAHAAFERAYDICRQVGDTPELLESAFGLCRVFWVRGELARAREIAERMQSMVADGTDPIRTMAARTALGSALLGQGEWTGAVAAFRLAIDLSSSHWHDGLLGVYASDLEVVSLSSMANCLQISGYPDQASRHTDESLRIGGLRSHPIAQGASMWAAALFYQMRGDLVRLEECAGALSRLGAELIEFHVFANIFGGCALVLRGQAASGIELMRAGAGMLRHAGVALYELYALGLLATGYRTLGDRAEARRVITEALALAGRAGPNFYDPELHRIDGEIWLDSGQPGSVAAAEQSFARAIAIARRQSAHSWELRAALSLGRLRRQQGDEHAARALVSDTYAWFTEGFDTPDLKAARAFLSGAAESGSG